MASTATIPHQRSSVQVLQSSLQGRPRELPHRGCRRLGMHHRHCAGGGPGDVSDDVEGDAEGRDERNVSHGEEEGRSQASDDMPSTQQRGAPVFQRTGLALQWLQQHLDRRAKRNG